jgi:hypothetical protein
MKKTHVKRIIFTLLPIAIAMTTLAQGTLQPVRAALAATNGVTTTNPATMIVSNGGLNAFFGKKVAYYLAGSSDLSLYKTYFTLDSDGKLFLGYNIGGGRPTELVKYLSTFGLKANIEDGFSAFMKEGKTQGDIGFSYRGTYFFAGKLRFDRTSNQRQKKMTGARASALTNWNLMQDERTKIINTLSAKSTQEESAFDASIVGVSDPAKQRTAFVAKKLREYEDEFANLESEALIDEKAYTKIYKLWLSFNVYVPVTRSKYTVAPDLTSSAKDVYYSPWEFSLSLAGFVEGSAGTLYGSAGIGAKYTSNISAELEGITEIETTEYKNLGGVDTLKLANVNSSKVYIGTYDGFFTTQYKLQLVVYPRFIDFDVISLGLSASAEINSGKYDPLNLKFGLPIKLDADADGKPVNVELRGEFFDFRGTVTDKSPKKNFSFGLAVGLPFASLIK